MNKQNNLSFQRNYYTSDDSGKIFLISIFAALGLSLIVGLICGAIGSSIGLEEGELSKQLWFLIPSCCCAPIGFVVTFFSYNKIAKVNYRAANVKFKIGWKNTLICIMVALIALFGIQMFISCTDYLISLTGFKIEDGLFGLPIDNFGWFILNVVLLAFLPAVCEELIFRGVVLTGLRKTLSDGKAVLMSALLFTLMHSNLQQLVYPFLLGLILGWIVVRTGSTFASMIVHFVNNFLVVLFAYIETVTGGNIIGGNPTDWWFWLIAISLLIVTVLLIWIIDKFYFKHKNQAEVVETERGRLSLFVWISVAVGIILIILSILLN